MDAWDLDFVISGSQKAWMCPPGLVICAIGKRAWSAYDASTYPRFFWDIASARKSAAEGMTPTTPPLHLLFALDAALDLMIEEGVEAMWARHRSARGVRPGRVHELGLELLAERRYASDSLTAIRVPDGLSARAIIDAMVANHQVMLQAGQGAMTDQVLRVGHMGWVTEGTSRRRSTHSARRWQRPEFRAR